MSLHQNICAHLCRALDDEHLVRCFQLDVELHLLVEDLISYVSAEAYGNLYLVLSDFLPLLLSFGEKSDLSGASILSDTLLQEYRI